VCEKTKLKVILKKLKRDLPEDMSAKEIWNYAKTVNN